MLPRVERVHQRLEELAVGLLAVHQGLAQLLRPVEDDRLEIAAALDAYLPLWARDPAAIPSLDGARERRPRAAGAPRPMARAAPPWPAR